MPSNISPFELLVYLYKFMQTPEGVNFLASLGSIALIGYYLIKFIECARCVVYLIIVLLLVYMIGIYNGHILPEIPNIEDFQLFRFVLSHLTHGY